MMFSMCPVSETRPNETSLIEYQAELHADNVPLKVAGSINISVFYTPDPQIVRKRQVLTCITIVQDTKVLKTNIFPSICQYVQMAPEAVLYARVYVSLRQNVYACDLPQRSDSSTSLTVFNELLRKFHSSPASNSDFWKGKVIRFHNKIHSNNRLRWLAVKGSVTD